MEPNNRQITENILRPTHFTEYIGQTAVKEKIKVYIDAAKQRNEPVDHMLVYGPPGLGKTTLAGVIATEMDVNMRVTSGPAIEKPGELVAILSGLKEHDILFIDEIHRISRSVEEILYPAMEDFVIDIMINKDTAAKAIRLELPRFTLIGATTRTGLLSAPLRDRFGIVQKMEFYTPEELQMIVTNSASRLGIEIEEDGALEIARRSRGTPRLANRLLKRVRDFAQIKFDGTITKESACYALNILEVDSLGLDKNDRTLLSTLIEKFSGGPTGLETLSAAIGEDAGTLEDVYEPYLLMNGLISRTPRGRIVTDAGYVHMGRNKKTINAIGDGQS